MTRGEPEHQHAAHERRATSSRPGRMIRRTNLTAVQLPDNSKLTYGYDTAHRLTTRHRPVRQQHELHARCAWRHDAGASRESTQRTVTKQHSATFDALGRTLDGYRRREPDNGIHVRQERQRADDHAAFALGHRHQTYDALNRLSTHVRIRRRAARRRSPTTRMTACSRA